VNRDNVAEIKALVTKGTKRLNRFFYLGVVIGVLMGPTLLIASLIPTVRERVAGVDDPQNLVLFGGLMTFLFGVALIEQVFKYARDRRLLWRLGKNPRDIVWIYKEISLGRVQHRAGAKGAAVARFIHVCFHFVDGTKVLVWLNEAEADRLMDLVRQELTHATIGYSPEIEQAYQEKPSSLRAMPRQVEGVKQVTGGVRFS
jgi:hypothetical protein